MEKKGSGNRDQGSGVSEAEMQEAATELPAFLGCPQHMPTHLPGGFDGVGSATETVPPHGGGTRGEGVPPSQDVEKLNEILFERLGEIARKCCAMRVECDPEHVDYDAAETNIKLFGAFSELRQMCDFYKPREKPLDPTAPEVVHPQRLDDIGMQMDKVVIVDDDGVICKIRRAGVLMMGIGRPAQLWEIDAMKRPTCCRVQVFCDHKPIFDGKAFGKNLYRASALGLAVVVRFVLAQRKHQRKCRAARAAAST